MLSFLLPANPLLGSSSQRHVLQVVSTQQLIYVLVKKVSESNWLVQKLKGMVNSFLNEAEQSSYTT